MLPLTVLCNNEFPCSPFRSLTVSSFYLHPFDSLRTFYSNLFMHINKIIKKLTCPNEVLFVHDDMAYSSKLIPIKCWLHHCCTFFDLIFLY